MTFTKGFTGFFLAKPPEIGSHLDNKATWACTIHAQQPLQTIEKSLWILPKFSTTAKEARITCPKALRKKNCWKCTTAAFFSSFHALNLQPGIFFFKVFAGGPRATELCPTCRTTSVFAQKKVLQTAARFKGIQPRWLIRCLFLEELNQQNTSELLQNTTGVGSLSHILLLQNEKSLSELWSQVSLSSGAIIKVEPRLEEGRHCPQSF